MKLSDWPLIREYITAEIQLAHLRNIQRERNTSYRKSEPAELKEAIAKLEEQVTRMDNAIRSESPTEQLVAERVGMLKERS